MPEPTVAVLGASGFVGRAVTDALRKRGAVVTAVPAPRLSPLTASQARALDPGRDDTLRQVVDQVSECTVVVNAAGLSDSGHTDEGSLMAANGALPGLIAAAAAQRGVRFIHVSSAAVQGRTRCLDSTPTVRPFSAYSAAKALGEELALRHGGEVVVYRPPGVHSADRTVTAAIAAVARSPLAAVAAPGTANTAQALLENVADAVAFMALFDGTLPRLVHHPSEGLTTAGLMQALGGHRPRHIPAGVARHTITTAFALGARHQRILANARRLEMLWLGQDQAQSWLDEVDWAPPAGLDRWRELGRALGPLDEVAPTGTDQTGR